MKEEAPPARTYVPNTTAQRLQTGQGERPQREEHGLKGPSARSNSRRGR